MKMRLLLLVNVLLLGKAGALTQGEIDNCLYAHNALRTLHPGTPNMTWDASLQADAQAWADHLGDNVKGLQHATGLTDGENLYYKGYTGSMQVTCANSALAWYNEIADYSYTTTKTTDPSKMIGHFTQLVWTDSIRLGMGIKTVNEEGGWTKIYMVARYAPQGNFVMMNMAETYDDARVRVYGQKVLPQGGSVTVPTVEQLNSGALNSGSTSGSTTAAATAAATITEGSSSQNVVATSAQEATTATTTAAATTTGNSLSHNDATASPATTASTSRSATTDEATAATTTTSAAASVSQGDASTMTITLSPSAINQTFSTSSLIPTVSEIPTTLTPTTADVDECTSNPCDSNASCTNLPGSFTCSCNNGYRGNGFICEVCADLNAACGSYTQYCSYYGNVQDVCPVSCGVC